MSTCMICGKALTDPASIARGIGPKCWNGIRSINDEIKMRMDDMFGGKPDFTYKAVKGVIVITDLNKGGMSVTNGIDMVLDQIKMEKPTIVLDVIPIIYHDSDGAIDMIRTYENAFAGFAHLGCDNEAEAIEKAKQLHKDNGD